jgi:hypothetical protein
MTLRISMPGVPDHCVLKLSCDAGDCDAEQVFTEDDYVQQRSAATKAGWRERQSSAGRLFYCPQCAGKRSVGVRG